MSISSCLIFYFLFYSFLSPSFSFSSSSQRKQKYLWSNAIIPKESTHKRMPVGSIPGYDVYAMGFSICDQLNRSLRHRSYPHQMRGDESDLKRYFDYILSCVLHNTFAIYNYIHDLDRSFQDLSLELSMELFQDSLLNN